MREYRRLADRMIAIQPANAEWRMEQGNANANLGIVLLDRRRFSEATRHFTEALRTMKKTLCGGGTGQCRLSTLAR